MLDEDGNQRIGRLEAACPRLSQKGHGSWYYSIELPLKVGGKRNRAVEGGFRTQKRASAEAKKAYNLALAGIDPHSKLTLKQYMEEWLEGKEDLAKSTADKYGQHIRDVIAPYIGHVELVDLRPDHIREMFSAIADENSARDAHRARVEALTEDCAAKQAEWKQIPRGTRADQAKRAEARKQWDEAKALLAEERKKLKRLTGPVTQHRILATLSSALEDAVSSEKVTRNWASLVHLTPAPRPRALVWTPARVAELQRTGEKPSSVMLWTPEQTGQFLDATHDDRLHTLWHLLALRGLRRGEACALPWSEVDLETRTIHISRQIVTVSYETFQEEPKADSVRTISIDRETVELLRLLREQQIAEREAWNAGHKNDAWQDTGAVFTKEDGSMYHPDYLTHRFALLAEKLGLPPITLHGLRHGTAGIANAAGLTLKDISDLLGHSGIQITGDTYTTVFPQFKQAQAEASLSVVPRTRRVTQAAEPAPPTEAAATRAAATHRERSKARKRVRILAAS
ncbi:site-specific integrase [Kitasatospora acidiphila]|uniref:Site-specific integrase n=1 Tax=Kitasatospora acidiphila TaxID=2567942 RepID=A0A540W929_9ACTN|nr:tyrosine-type recombinase/integrase [Kitasatospora acidiphila]TQF05521.1 site-specific integrase [Kitasatospora acidiphila]